MITIIAKFSVNADKTEEFKKRAINLLRETRKEKGCLSYKIYQGRQDASKFTFIEEWLNDTAIEQHNEAKHFCEFLAGIKHITSDMNIEQLSTVPTAFC